MAPVTDPRELPGLAFHSEATCDDGTFRPCVIHHPSAHHMRKWPCTMRASTLIERHCPHGIGHPDPDSADYFDRHFPEFDLSSHGCDGCCVAPKAQPLGYGKDIPVTPEEDEYFGDPNQFSRSNR